MARQLFRQRSGGMSSVMPIITPSRLSISDNIWTVALATVASSARCTAEGKFSHSTFPGQAAQALRQRHVAAGSGRERLDVVEPAGRNVLGQRTAIGVEVAADELSVLMENLGRLVVVRKVILAEGVGPDDLRHNVAAVVGVRGRRGGHDRVNLAMLGGRDSHRA